MTDHLKLTSEAAQKIYAESQQADGKLVRLFVAGGGCAGLQYGFVPEDKQEEDDQVIKKTIQITDENQQSVQAELTLILDPISAIYLRDAEIDYLETPCCAQLIVRNPKIRGTCGCHGAVFRTEDEKDS